MAVRWAGSARDFASPEGTLEVRPGSTVAGSSQNWLLSLLLVRASHPGSGRSCPVSHSPRHPCFCFVEPPRGSGPGLGCKLLGSTKLTLSCAGVLRRLHKNVVSSFGLATTGSLSVQKAWHILGDSLGLSLRIRIVN